MVHYAFYVAKGSLISWLIRKRSNHRASHIEIVFSNGDSFSFSEKDRGGRYKAGAERINFHEKEDEAIKWAMVPVPELDEEWVRAECDKVDGAKYDFRAILRYALGVDMPSNEMWFCSEWGADILRRGVKWATYLDPSKVSPGDLMDILRVRLQDILVSEKYG